MSALVASRPGPAIYLGLAIQSSIPLYVSSLRSTRPGFDAYQNHAFARYVLPVAESEIKAQDWPGKKKTEEKKKEQEGKKQEDRNQDHDVKNDENDEDDQSDEDNSDSREDAQAKESESQEGKQGPKMTDEQQSFLDKLLAEMRLIESFKNNTAEPQGELKLLDQEALHQLESRLSIDDQCVDYLVLHLQFQADPQEHTRFLDSAFIRVASPHRQASSER